METLLRYEHVDIAYLGQPAVEDVSFSLSSGEILGIVGGKRQRQIHPDQSGYGSAWQ